MDTSISTQSKFICLVMAIIMILGIFISAGTSVYAAEQTKVDTEYYSQEEYDKAVDNLAIAFQEQYDSTVKSNPNLTEEDIVKSILLFTFSDESHSINKRSLDSFGQCMMQKLGISELKNIAKQVFNKQVVQALKSKAWKKASSIIANAITKYAGKKMASWAIKKIAHYFLPGTGWFSLGVAVGQCGLGEL